MLSKNPFVNSWLVSESFSVKHLISTHVTSILLHNVLSGHYPKWPLFEKNTSSASWIAYNDVDKLYWNSFKNALLGLFLLYSMKSDWKRLTALWLWGTSSEMTRSTDRRCFHDSLFSACSSAFKLCSKLVFWQRAMTLIRLFYFSSTFGVLL